MKDETKIEFTKKPEKFIEGIDYFFEDGLMILTAHFLLKRGYCCQNGCRNCPYAKGGNKNLQQESF
jgi:hypothetical protein